MGLEWKKTQRPIKFVWNMTKIIDTTVDSIWSYLAVRYAPIRSFVYKPEPAHVAANRLPVSITGLFAS